MSERAGLQPTRAIAVVVAIAGGLVAASLLGLARVPELSTALIPTPAWVVVAIAALFALVERFAFVVQFRREAIGYTMSELPIALSMLYLGVREAMLATVVATIVVAVATWRVVWFKLLFNSALLMFEMTVAFLIFRGLMGDEVEFGSRFIVSLTVALMSVTLIETLFVSVAVSCFEGNFGARFQQEVLTNGPMVVVSSIGATILASFSEQWPQFTALGLVPVAAIWMVLRSNGTNSQRLKDFEALHRLSNTVSRSLHREEIAGAVIGEVQDILRSDRAAIVQIDRRDGSLRALAAVGDEFRDLPTSIEDARWRPFLEGSTAVLLEPMVLASLGISLGVKDNVILAPVHDGEQTIGFLLVAERSGPQSSYDDSDVLRAAAIANRLSSALRNAELHEQIEEEAWRDRLTGLPNRNAFERAVVESQAACSLGDVLGVVVLGIDRFREVNETLGHQVGDAILIEMGRRLADEVGEGAVLARVTGDEFGVLIAPCELDALIASARRLVEVMKRPLVVDGIEIIVDVGAGVATCALCGLSAPDLLRQADVAMNWAKDHHTAVEVYRGEIDLNTPGRLALLSDLRGALERRHLDVWFQPKIDLVSNVVVGAEALVRWEHPTLGMVPPNQFVPLAETTGLVTELTDVVLGKSMAAVRLLNDVGFRLDVSVNLSTIDLLHEDLVERVQRYLAAHEVPSDQLTLEITETALLEDGQRALSTAEDLRALGVHLSIDDFGTGFSSLSYLRTLPASEIKVDRSFVLNLMRDERDEVIVRSTIDLGHNLGLKVTAEGVEDSATLERLSHLGCDLAQGFHIAKPMPLTHFVAWLTTSGHQVARSGIQGAWKPSTSPLDA